MEFGILGPLVVSDAGREVELRGAKQRLLLAALLLEPGRAVATDRLVELLWPDAQPANPRNALQSQVSHLRRMLGPRTDLLVARPPGYCLSIEPGQLDAGRFEDLVAQARGAADIGEVERAAELWRQALGLWRGPPLDEFADHPAMVSEANRLEQLRLNVIEERIDAELEAAREVALLPELEALVAEHPLRERLRGQLMLALYRAGRQADALAVYHDTRRVLDEELGIAPSPELARRYEALLRQQDDGPRRQEPRPAASPDHPVGTLRPGRIPAAVSSFVGRDEEVSRVRALVAGARLVTLTGPGGVGKTRLAAEAAARIRDERDDPGRVWFVELAAIEDGALIADTVAQALGLTEDAGGALAAGTAGGAMARLTAALRGADALVVLDNCEHLVEAAAAFARDLLTATSQLRLLCTSREPLGVTGEAMWSVPSLTIPPADAGDDPEGLRRWGAVRLFTDRVRASDPVWELDASSAPLVAEICRRLDGIPLAIELAAARVRTLGLEELAGRLEDRFRILTGGDRTAQPRQRTLRAVVDWSWELLDGAERSLFRRLSVFAGGATLADAERVCAGTPVEVDEVVDLLAGLVDKSVVFVDRAHAALRYRMLETLRAYGQQRLREAGESEQLHERHAQQFLELVRRTVPLLRGGRQLNAMAHLDAALDDLRVALRWCDTSGDAARGAELATELGWYWYLRGLRVEGLGWMRTFAASAAPREAALIDLWCAFLEVEGVDPRESRQLFDHAIGRLFDHGDAADRAFAQLLAADLSAVMGDHDAVPVYLSAARRSAAEADDDGYRATADFVAGHQQLMLGDVQAAQPWLERALTRFQQVGDRWGQVQCRMALASDAGIESDLESAVEHVDEAVKLSRQLHLRELEGILHGRRATLAVHAGDLGRAVEEIQAADRITEELGADFLRVNSDLAAGLVGLRTGDYRTADERLRAALAWLDGSPQPLLTSYALARLATVTELRGETADAVQLARRAVEVAVSSPAGRGLGIALAALAATYAAAGRPEDAALLLGAARSHDRGSHHLGEEWEDVESSRAEDTARAAMGDQRFEELVDRGGSLDLAELPLS